jgi:acetyl esterase/lipase
MHQSSALIAKHPLLLLFYVVFSLVFTACQKETASVAEERGAKTTLNVSYGADTAQRMDVYLPLNRSADSTKVVVLIHGGSWTSGDKAELAAYVDTLKRRLPHIAIININYRLASSTRPLTAPEEDVKAAVNFIAANSGDWGIHKNAIGLLGVSAGGHLALLQAYKQTTPVRIKAVVDFFGPTDLVTMYQQPWHPLVQVLLSSLIGTIPGINLAAYQASSPVQFVAASNPPTLILHGGADEVVAISQSYALKNKLDAAGVVNQMQVYPLEGHGWYNANMKHSFDLVETFLRTYL